MIKNEKGFSLIEVIIATGILTISVFGVYKLIGENTKIINNSGNQIQVNSLFPVFEECIENIGFSAFKGSSLNYYKFDFGNTLDLNNCNHTWIGNSVIIDNIEYILEGSITNSGSDFINWELSISSDESKTITGSYLQIND